MQWVDAFLAKIPILYPVKTPENVDAFEWILSLIWSNIL